MSRTTVLHLAKIAGISGAETHLLSLLPRLRERGWDVRLLQLHEDEPGAHHFADALRDLGVPVDMIRLRADIDPVAFARVTAYLARSRPLILHTHLVHADVYGQLAGAFAAVPLRMSTKHGFNEFRENRGFAVADRAVGGLAHVHIAISRGLARYLADVEGFDETDFAIVHYGIVPGPDPVPGPDEPRFLCIGRLIPIKGHVVLLRALALALKDAPELTLEIAGRGPLEPALKAVAKELGVEHAVHFLGYVAPIQRAIDDSAVVVVPSLGEGFGMVALEAMERARPVLAAEIGGLGELVVDGRTGLLVPPGEAEPLARALVELARDPQRRRELGEAGRRRALEHFAEHRNVERTELLYRAMLSSDDSTSSLLRGTGFSLSPAKSGAASPPAPPTAPR
jgi:glycosyltransferase involved in cell wall biosynthesis